MAIIGGGTLESGKKFAVATEDNGNAIYWLNGSEPSRWEGDSVSCCTACGETVVCVTLKGLIYLISSDRVSSLGSDVSEHMIFGVCSLGPDRALAGGSNGILLEINLETGTTGVTRASSLGLRKPGRDIINIVTFMGSVAAIGKRELIYTFSESLEAAEAYGGSGNEAFFYNGCELSGELWLSGLVGRSGVLARYVKSSNSVEYFPTPSDANGRAFSIEAIGDNLILANDFVFTGKPDKWVRLDGFDGPECIAILPSKASATCTLVSIKGQILEITL